MSHTVGQAEQDNQNSNSDRDLSSVEDKTSQSTSLLSDADYEFLFNQLLEGVAHGWHDRRIIKFFKQLGDRGKPKDWINWLERLRPKIITLPIQSKRQLGTVMIRLGELTQSASEVKEIGRVSNRIGRELLFGNVESPIWEYDGPDLAHPQSDNSVGELETEEKLSERLPKDFAELGSAAIEETETNLARDLDSTELVEEVVSATESPVEEIREEVAPQPQKLDENLALESSDLAGEEPWEEIELDENSLSEEDATPNLEESTETFSHTSSTEETAKINNFDQDFEFELQDEPAEPDTEDLIQTPESLELVKDPLKTVAVQNNSKAIDLAEDLAENDPEAIDFERVIALIQEDETLAREISEKLNLSLTNIESSDSQSNLDTSLIESLDSDGSNIDLIEGWFNLGLKQVSGGEFDKAIASWEKALKINPNLSEAWHNRGSALGRLGRYDEAVDSFQKALTINPNNYQAWNDRAHALYQLKNWQRAAESWGNALKITPGNHLFWYNRGCALEQLELWAESIASYEKSLEIKPDFAPARTRYTNLIADNSRAN